MTDFFINLLRILVFVSLVATTVDLYKKAKEIKNKKNTKVKEKK